MLCMPTQYVAGIMMMVRAMVADLRLIEVEPSANPLKNVAQHIGFAAMTPMQVYSSLQDEAEAERLRRISVLLIGGAAIDDKLAETLRTFPNAIYSTYGMTETVSHIALRRISGDEAADSYTPLPSVSIALSDHGTLTIDAPAISAETIVTNDYACILPDGSFRITGRADNVINSGGIKLQIEEIEQKLAADNPCAFAITSVTDSKYGQAVVLLVEGCDPKAVELRSLGKYERPKHTIRIGSIPLTPTGKIDRKACKNIAEKIVM